MKGKGTFFLGFAGGALVTLALIGVFRLAGFTLSFSFSAVPPKADRVTNSEAPSPPTRGPSDAVITLTEFADFHCPFCKKMAPTLERLMKSYPEKIRWVFRHFPLSSTPGTGSFLTHEASVCAQEQGKFWEFHDALFALPGVPQESDLHAIARTLGLKRSKFEECLRSGRTQGFLQEELSEGRRRGVQGTPTVFVNDRPVAGAYPYEHFVNTIEQILSPGRAQAARPPSLASTPPAPPAVAQFDDLEGRPSLGPKDAPVTLVEFSDFHCPFCKKVAPTLEKLRENYPGKIRHVWRHYPLASIHPGAPRTHEASECAHEQGKFWEYHDKLFEIQGRVRDDTGLIRLAEELGLDKKKFEQCLTSGKYRELVQKEISKAEQRGAQGTPTIFVNGRIVSGARPYENFERIVKDELAKS